MEKRFSISLDERKKLFCSELIKQGVPYETALRASEVLTLWLENEPLPPEDMEFAEKVCQEWLKQRKRWDALSALVNSLEIPSDFTEPRTSLTSGSGSTSSGSPTWRS